MENNLGISGAVIEDFDDYDLIEGLTITGPLYCSEHFCGGNTWGDSSTNAFMVYPKLVDTADINISSGVELIGFGLGYCEFYDFNHTVMVINNEYTIPPAIIIRRKDIENIVIYFRPIL